MRQRIEGAERQARRVFVVAARDEDERLLLLNGSFPLRLHMQPSKGNQDNQRNQ
jgi:hypothetical protein